MTGMGDISFSQCLILTEKQHAQCMQEMLTEPDRAGGERGISYRMRKHGPGEAQWLKELAAQTWWSEFISRNPHRSGRGKLTPQSCPLTTTWPHTSCMHAHTRTHTQHTRTHTHNYIKIWANRNLVRHARSEKWNLQRWLSDVTMSTVTSTGHMFFVHTPRLIISWTREHASADLKGLKSHKVYILPTAEFNMSTTEESGKSPNIWKLNNILLNSSWVKEVIRRINTLLN